MKSTALVLLFLLVALFAAYWNVVRIPYAFMDDYFWLYTSVHHPDAEFGFLAAQGRPLNAVILRAAFRMAGTIGNLRWVRAGIIAESAFAGTLFYWAIRRCGWDRFAAAILACLACLVPAMQVYIAWTTSVPLPWSVMAATLAAMGTSWAMDNLSKRWPTLIIAAIGLGVSAMIYQPSAMVFWPVAAVDLFRRISIRERFRRLAVYFCVSIVGLAMGWAVFQLGLKHYAYYVKSERSHLAGDPIAKITWFIRQPLVDALNPFRIFSHPAIAIGFGAFLIVGLLCYFQGKLGQRILTLAIAAALFPLAYLPNLAAVENWPSYRTQIGLEWLTLLLAWLALNGIFQTFGKWKAQAEVLVVALIFCVILAGYHVTVFFAEPQMAELTLLRGELARPEVRNATRIIFLQPLWAERLAPFSRYDEFGRNSMHAGWVPQAAVDLIRLEQDPNAARIEVDIKPDVTGPWTEIEPPGVAVIDFRDLKDVR